jgi:homocysteine S-methyltransferase
MMSDLLGAARLGLHNLLIITAIRRRWGPYPDATAVFDIDAIGLTNMVNKLNHGVDIGNNPIGKPTAFRSGRRKSGAVNLEEESDDSNGRSRRARIRDHSAGFRYRQLKAFSKRSRT